MPKWKIDHIDNLANRCGYFYNAYLEKGISVNNGYNCRHPEQEEVEEIEGQEIGRCFCFSCPLGSEAEAEDFDNPDLDKNGFDEVSEGELIITNY